MIHSRQERTIGLSVDHPLKGLFAAKAAAPGASGWCVDSILDAVRTHLGMDIAFASRFVDGRREFTHISANCPVPAQPGDSEPVEDTYCHRIIQGRLPELILDASTYEAAADLPITKALPVGSHLNVPLRLRDGSLYGTFCCLSRKPDLSLTARDLSTLRAFADLAADQIDRQLIDDRQREETRARIAEVLAGDRLAIAYQPIHSLADGRPAGVECLARFHDADARPPNLWFAEAATVGLDVELELLAVRQAIRGLPYIPAPFYVAVNVSPAAILSGQLETILEGIPPKRLVLEVTEHSQVVDYSQLLQALAGLRDRVRIAVDDVGAGYSGLRHILDLRPDIMKLDMSLTRDVDRDKARGVLAQAMVRFASGIQSQIVAEGVETAAEMEMLRSLGVGYAQGFHLSRPMPAVAAHQFLVGAEEAADQPAARRRAAAAPAISRARAGAR
jgi:EAL domain-containing protein (putative c-di-GMP-specific phosphodiesterase class I)